MIAPAAQSRPAALAALIDAMTDLLGGPDEAMVFAAAARSATVAPGADLAPVATLAMLRLLAAEEWRRWRPDVIARIVDCHRAALAGEMPDWTALRAHVVATSETAREERERMVAAGWEAACWPAAEGRSVLVSTLGAWWAIIHHEEWSDAVDADARRVLDDIWNEQQAARDAGASPDYPALFRAREPALCAAYEGNLERDNRYRRDCLEAFAVDLLRLLEEAGAR